MTHPILFLDIDGVLNCHEFDKRIMCGQIHKDKVYLLTEGKLLALRRRTHARKPARTDLPK